MPFSWLRKRADKPYVRSVKPVTACTEVPDDSTPDPELLAASCLWNQQSAMLPQAAGRLRPMPESPCGFITGAPDENRYETEMVRTPAPAAPQSVAAVLEAEPPAMTDRPSSDAGTGPEKQPEPQADNKPELHDDWDSPFRSSDFSLWGNRLPAGKASPVSGKRAILNH